MKIWTSTCSNQLKWQPADVQCVNDIEMTCDEPFQPLNSHRKLPKRYIVGEEVTYKCNEGDLWISAAI